MGLEPDVTNVMAGLPPVFDTSSVAQPAGQLALLKPLDANIAAPAPGTSASKTTTMPAIPTQSGKQPVRMRKKRFSLAVIREWIEPPVWVEQKAWTRIPTRLLRHLSVSSHS